MQKFMIDTGFQDITGNTWVTLAFILLPLGVTACSFGCSKPQTDVTWQVLVAVADTGEVVPIPSDDECVEHCDDEQFGIDPTEITKCDTEVVHYPSTGGDYYVFHCQGTGYPDCI